MDEGGHSFSVQRSFSVLLLLTLTYFDRLRTVSVEISCQAHHVKMRYFLPMGGQSLVLDINWAREFLWSRLFLCYIVFSVHCGSSALLVISEFCFLALAHLGYARAFLMVRPGSACQVNTVSQLIDIPLLNYQDSWTSKRFNIMLRLSGYGI